MSDSDSRERRRPVVVGVAGGSGSGKSTLVRELVRSLEPTAATVIQHDAYYLDMSHLEPAERAARNFDHPDSLETELLRVHLTQLLRGRSASVPKYDFASHTRSKDSLLITPTPLVIVEGILVLVHSELRALMDLQVFVHADPDVRLARRVRRDTRDRDRTAESVVDQFQRSVHPMHVEFVEPSRRHADLTIEEGGYNHAAVAALTERIRGLLRDADE